MTNEEIFTLMDRFQRSDLQSLKLSQEGFSIELCRATPAPAPVFAAPAPVFAAPAAPAAPAAAPAPAQESAHVSSAAPYSRNAVAGGMTLSRDEIAAITRAVLERLER